MNTCHSTQSLSKAIKSNGWLTDLKELSSGGSEKKENAHVDLEKKFERAELDHLYRSDGMTRRIVDIVPSEMVRQGWEIAGDSDQKCNAKLESIKASCHLMTALRWSRLYGGALCVMGITDGRSLNEPVDESNIRDVKWLRVFDRYQCSNRDDTFESDLNHPNYGFPNVYTVTDTRTGAVFDVHHSRILRTDWSVLPARGHPFNNGWGESLINSIYDELHNYSTALANAGLIMQYHEKASINITGISELLDRFMLALSAVSGVPISLLFGRNGSAQNTADENDIRNFYDMVKQEQESKLRPMIEKLTHYIMFSKEGPFAGIEPNQWSIQFASLRHNTDEQTAAIRKIVAETDAIYIDCGVLDPNEVAASRFCDNQWSMNTKVDLESRKASTLRERLVQEEIRPGQYSS